MTDALEDPAVAHTVRRYRVRMQYGEPGPPVTASKSGGALRRKQGGTVDRKTHP